MGVLRKGDTMGDYILEDAWTRVRDFFLDQLQETEPSSSLDPMEFECRQIERRFHESQYFHVPHYFFQDRAGLERCRARRDPAPVAAFAEEGEPGLKLLDRALNGLESLGRGVQAYAQRSWEYWKDPTDIGGQIIKILVIAGLGGGGATEEENEVRKTKTGGLRGNLHFRGKSYDLKTQDDKIIVNGRAWKFDGTTAKTEAASIRLESLSLDEAEESLQLEIVGSVACFEERVNKTLQGDQVEKLLEALANGDSAISTPDMEAKGIRLIPADMS